MSVISQQPQENLCRRCGVKHCPLFRYFLCYANLCVWFTPDPIEYKKRIKEL